MRQRQYLFILGRCFKRLRSEIAYREGDIVEFKDFGDLKREIGL